MSDNLKVSRFKVYCPRCEEVYIPKFKYVNIDGAFFGTSFPHQFLKHYSQAVILPPKIYHYEPQISGFKIMGREAASISTHQKEISGITKTPWAELKKRGF